MGVVPNYDINNILLEEVKEIDLLQWLRGLGLLELQCSEPG